MKTYVITLSERFPAYHPRRGEDTLFAKHLYYSTHCDLELKKLHTIRGNYKFWKKRVDEINAGRGVLSVRQWMGKPYFSKQFELMQYDKIGIQKCNVEFYNSFGFITIDKHLRYDGITVLSVCLNDGLSTQDFAAWFKKPIIDGCILHFSDLRY